MDVIEQNAASHTLVTEVLSLSSRLAQFNLGGSRRAEPSVRRPVTKTQSATVAPPRRAKHRVLLRSQHAAWATNWPRQ
jgi:methyl-accepting chemotaxis protein/methyl-accepting chemotaxis protein-1 (serine sensor receptor)